MAISTPIKSQRQLAERLDVGEPTIRRWLKHPAWPCKTTPPWSEAELERISSWATAMFDPYAERQPIESRDAAQSEDSPATSAVDRLPTILITAEFVRDFSADEIRSAGIKAKLMPVKMAREIAAQVNSEMIDRLRADHEKAMRNASPDECEVMRRDWRCADGKYLVALAEQTGVTAEDIMDRIAAEAYPPYAQALEKNGVV